MAAGCSRTTPAMQAAGYRGHGQAGDEAAKDLDDTLKAAAGDVAGVIKSVDNFGQPGTYQVTISSASDLLVPAWPTVDIQRGAPRVDSRCTTHSSGKASGLANAWRSPARSAVGVGPQAVPGGVEARPADCGCCSLELKFLVEPLLIPLLRCPRRSLRIPLKPGTSPCRADADARASVFTPAITRSCCKASASVISRRRRSDERRHPGPAPNGGRGFANHHQVT